MASRVSIFFAKLFAGFLQFTIGLVLPWWLIDVIHNLILSGYSSKFSEFGKLHRFTYGLILPWWLLVFISGNKLGKTEGSLESSDNNNSKSKQSKISIFKCHGCGMVIEYEANGNYPKDGHPYFNDLCSTPKSGGSVYRDRKYHQFHKC